MGSDDDNWTCPTCGDTFGTENGMKVHHVKVHDESVAGVEVICSYCGDETRVERSRAERDGPVFCDKDCRGEWMSENLVGEDHPRYSKVEAECANCGATREVHPYRLEEQDRVFCNHDCYGEWISENQSGEDSVHWKGGYSKYRGTDWPQLRQRVLEAEGYECQGCGTTEAEHREEHDVGLHVHHIRPVTEFDDPADADTVDNLVPLCRECHREWEGIPVRPSTN